MGMENVKQAYTTNEWAEREAYYTSECAKIVIPRDPNSKDMMRLTSMIDAILSEALLDQAYIKRNYLEFKNKMVLAEKETFVIIKQQNSMKGKLTENDVKGLVVTYLNSNPLQGHNNSIYTLVQAVEYRLTFIESVVKILTEKKAALISDNAMMKIEASIQR